MVTQQKKWFVLLPYGTGHQSTEQQKTTALQQNDHRFTVSFFLQSLHVLPAVLQKFSGDIII